MGLIAPGGVRRDHALWTLVLGATALAAFVVPIGLVSPRSRTVVGPSSESQVLPDREPPPSPLALPRPPLATGTPDARTIPAGESARKAGDAGEGLHGPPPASIEHAPELATLELRVTRDGRAEGGASVELVHEPQEASPDAPQALQVCTSDAEGRVRVALAPGTVRAVAWSADACALPASAELALGSPAQLELTLEPAYPVAGRVTDAATGAPIAGATVALWTFAERDTVTTGPDGRFLHPRFPARAPAQQIQARAAGHGSTVRYLRIGADGSWKLSAATAGEASVKGTGTPWLELALVPELRVRGRVVDAEGSPIAGARLAAEGFFQAMPSVAARDATEATSAADGRFELAGLRSDIGHGLLVSAPGRAEELVELPGGTTLHDVGTLTLLAETLLAGAALDADGLPLAGVEIVLRSAPLEPATSAGPLDVAARIQGREQRVTTTPEGTFLFEHLAPRPLTLTLEHEGGARVELALTPRPDGRFEPPCLVLPPLPIVAER